MSGDQMASFVAGIMCLVLVGSSLIARRLDWNRTLKLALVWVAIFAAVIFVVSFFVGPSGERRERGSDWVQAAPTSPAVVVYFT